MKLDLKCRKCGNAVQVEFDEEFFSASFVTSAVICDGCAEGYDAVARKARQRSQRASELHRAKAGRSDPYRDD